MTQQQALCRSRPAMHAYAFFVCCSCAQVLLVWRAHMNLQLVTQTAWSRYLLKYTLKVRAQPCLTHSGAVTLPLCATRCAPPHPP